MIFKVCTDIFEFFKILPKDWQDDIVPFWEDYSETTKCYVLLDNSQIIAGGLVFSICPPDMLYAKAEANTWLHKGYQYLGFIFVIEERRQQNLGSLWLSELKAIDPTQNYWLTIEDLKLDAFYVKNGFQHIKFLNNTGTEEALYIFEAT